MESTSAWCTILRETVDFSQHHYLEASGGRSFSTFPILMVYYKALLTGLRYLHHDCHVIHTDLKLSNILFIMENSKTLLLNYETYALENPSSRRILPDREVYVSDSDFGGWVKREAPLAVISDFGNAVRGDQGVYGHFIQPDPFCGPDISFGMAWSYIVDIWNLRGVLVRVLRQLLSTILIIPRLALHMFECLCMKSQISSLDSKEKFDILVQMAPTKRLLGPPPVELINRIHPECRSMLFENGPFKHRRYYPPRNEGIFEVLFSTIPDSWQEEFFIAFLKRMLRRLPEERASIDELLADPWMSSVQASRNR
ncbi:kinase-like domain-containing protein [Armillaria borealis]|uniref:Kinase-like domain-containing protein n=1 Tax=Armillaria borealis TaxID=47425 RepID=A0AA39MEA3_9AGAR|nr:kinase-like domain-containing protein [Armillaria borealis]